jgi:hypothetical protein
MTVANDSTNNTPLLAAAFTARHPLHTRVVACPCQLQLQRAHLANREQACRLPLILKNALWSQKVLLLLLL